MFKKFVINTVVVIILLCFAELLCFNTAKKENDVFKSKTDKLAANNSKSYKTKYTILSDFKPILWRKSFIIENSDKKPIIWFGCSFAEGAGLSDTQAPCGKISKMTGRSCINRAKGATGTQFMYYQLTKEDFFKQAPQADYVIYTFIWHHLRRLYNYQINPLVDMFNVRYKLLNGNLIEVKPFFKPFYSSFIIKRFLNKIELKKSEEEEKDFKLFNALIKESVRITSEKYPASKFIMIEFPDLSNRELPDYEIKNLEKMGITVIRVNDIVKNTDFTDKKYWLEDNIHPSEEAWNIILPEITAKYIK